MRRIPVTTGFDNASLVGWAEIQDNILRALISGRFRIAPAYIEHSDGSIEVVELSIVADNAAQPCNQATSGPQGESNSSESQATSA